MTLRKSMNVQGEGRDWPQITFYLFFLYFACKTVYFAISIRDHVFPDEATWFGIVEIFSRQYFFPVDSPESHPLGLITHVPNLYFFLMGKILTINPFINSDLIFLRLVNVCLGLASVYVAWRLICLLALGSWARVLFFVMLTNTAMYTFIFGAVNYDNASNLFAVLSLYCLTTFFQRRRPYAFLFFWIFVLAGMLTKNVFLPYAFALVLVLVFHERKKIVDLSWLKTFFSNRTPGTLFLGVVCLLLLVLNLSLYGGNKIKYGVLIPSMEMVLPVEDCLVNRLFARNYGANQFKAGQMTIVDAQRIALQVRDPGDRAFAWTMIDKAKQEKNENKQVRMGSLQYSVEWCKYIFTRTYGVAAHLVMEKNPKMLYPYYAVFCLGLVFLLLKIGIWRREIGYLFFITFFYISILMQVVNYNNYLSSGFVGLALTGRYLFPVLVPLYLLVAYGLIEKMPKWWQWGVGVIVGGFFIYGEFPWFLQNVTPNWYF